MGKGYLKLNTRPAAQSHNAHHYNTPKHGKTWEGFKVRPAKPEVVPVYSTAPKINLNTPTGKILGAVLLFAAAGSVIKVADAQCVNPRPVPHSFRNALGTTTTVNCADADLFYGPQIQEYRPSSRSFTIYHAQNRIISEYTCRDTWQWNWASDCSTTYRSVSEAVGTARYESIVIMDGVSRQICRNNGNVDKFRGTNDESATLRSKSLASVTDFAATCSDVASRCAQINTYVCQTPSVTPSPKPTSKVTTILASSPQTSTVALTSSAETAISTSSSEVEATPSPTSKAEEIASEPSKNPGGAVAGAVIVSLAAAGGVLAGSLGIARLMKHKCDQDEAQDQNQDNQLSNVTQTTQPVVEVPQNQVVTEEIPV